MEEKKKLKKYVKPALAVTAAVLLLTAILAAIIPGYSVLIIDSDSKFYRGKKLLLAGNSLICMRDKESYLTRKEALGTLDPEYTFALIPVNKISRIEIIPDGEETVAENVPGIPRNFIGGYRIVASGHRGILNLFVSKGKLYGSVKFPEWANGVWEYLKYLKINNNRLYFTRSITNSGELKRIGASSYFTQSYSGTYSQNGKVIKGFYTIRGVKNQWEAERIR